MAYYMAVLGLGVTIFLFGKSHAEHGYYMLDKTDWQCTAQVRVGDTLPAEYECTQYTKAKP